MRAFWYLAGISPALAASSGQFNVLSFNVAGLPEIFNSNEVPGDKSTNSEQIGTKFAEYGYDVIHVQEVRHAQAASRSRLTPAGLQLPRLHLQNR
jgi:endonuclease/exonuclease/phosphatase family metal-dependent hydrolase